jgi:LysR family glycine cleavage system transcriptional activator
MSRRLPPLTALRSFEAAARHGSFARAADELAVTQAAISHQVRELEDWLGVPLFTRLHRGVRLSDAGERYLASLTSAFDEMAQATAAMLDDSAAATLTVSAEPAFAARWLLPRLAGFRQRHPDIELDLDPDSSLVDFRSEAVDVAVRYGPGEWPELEKEHLVDIVAFPVCSPALVAGEHPLRAPADLAHHALLHDDTTDGWREWLAIAGQGVALGDNLLSATDLASGRLVRPFAVPVSPCHAYWLVAPPAHRERPGVAAFWAWLAEEMRAFLATPAPAAKPRRLRRAR